MPTGSTGRRKEMKKWIAVLCALVLAQMCRARDKIKVVATVPDLAWVAGEIGGNRVKVYTLARGGQDLHSVRARPTFLLKLKRADLFLELGLDAEHAWVPPLLFACRNPKVQPDGAGFVNCSIGIKPLEVPSTISRKEAADLHPLGNPHYNLEPGNMKIVARNILEGLCRVDPGSSKFYRKRFEGLMEKFKKKEEYWDALAKDLKGLKVVTYHRSWSYFAGRFGIKVIGTIEPKPGIEATPSHLARLIETIKKEKVKIIIREPYYSEKLPSWIAERTGARVVTLPNTSGWRDTAKTWFQLMDYILKSLRRAAGLPEEPEKVKGNG